MLFHRVGQLEEHAGPLAGRRLEPRGKRVLRRLDRTLDIRLGAPRDLGDRLAGRRVHDLLRPALDGVHPFAADQVLVPRYRNAHGLSRPLAVTAVFPRY